MVQLHRRELSSHRAEAACRPAAAGKSILQVSQTPVPKVQDVHKSGIHNLGEPVHRKYNWHTSSSQINPVYYSATCVCSHAVFQRQNEWEW